MDRGHLRGISETSVSTVGGYATPMESQPHPRSPGSPYGPDSYSQIRERERSVGREGEEGDGIQRQDGKRPSLVSPLSPPDGHHGDDYLGGPVAGSEGTTRSGLSPGGAGGVSPTGTGTTRRKSNFQESLD